MFCTILLNLFSSITTTKFYLTGKEFRETCSGHGKFIATRCKCDKNYYGARCQYWDECTEDRDCGAQGKCVNLQGTALPKRQCYCQLGWFGPGCNSSELKSFLFF